MSDTETTPETAPETTEDITEETAEATEPAEPDDLEAAPDAREAAKYRRKLREAEKERDGLAARVEALQRQHAETMLAASGVKPQAVWAVAELADILAEDGTVDSDKLDAAVATAREKFGIAKTPKGNYVPGVGNQPSVMPKPDKWREAFAPPR